MLYNHHALKAFINFPLFEPYFQQLYMQYMHLLLRSSISASFDYNSVMQKYNSIQYNYLYLYFTINSLIFEYDVLSTVSMLITIYIARIAT